jgi:hypothetical protein
VFVSIKRKDIAMLTLEVHTKNIGSIKAEGPELLTLNLLEERLTIAELIQRAVEEGVREEAVKRAQKMPGIFAPAEAKQRGYLTEEEIAAQQQQGKIASPDQLSGLSTSDAQTQVKKALRAFQVGTYIVLIDNKRVKTLDEEITFSPTTSIQFLRLTPLIGG